MLSALGGYSGDNRRCTKGMDGGGYGKRDTATEEASEKDLDYYMNLSYNIDVISHDESGYTVGIRELPWITAINETMDIALELLDCNKDSWLEEAIKSGVPIPEPPRDDRYDLPAEISDAD